MEVKRTCPLGSECKVAKDGVLEVCRWLVEVQGEHPQTGVVVEEEQCAIAAQVWMIGDMAKSARQDTSAVYALRNKIHQAMTHEDSEPRRVGSDRTDN